MSGNERIDTKERIDSRGGPLGNLSQAYFGNLDMMARVCEPALKGAGRWNVELLGLMARRAQAWLEIPARLGRCKTPADLVSEQLRFWQSAAADYVEGQHKLSAALGSCAVLPRVNGQQPRDYIALSEPEQGEAPQKRSERRAA